MNNKFSLALKITNWCNLNCAHCCERSGAHIAPNIMPIENVKKYVAEFNALDVPKFEHLVFTGGEAMAPYLHRDFDYIPQCLETAFKNNMVPFLKTNATWGADKRRRGFILDDCAIAAYKYQRLVSLDISLDEFHDNVPQIANIITDILNTEYLNMAIRVTLVGLNTLGTKNRVNQLLAELARHKIKCQPLDDAFLLFGDGLAMMVFHDFYTPIARMGRAADNAMGRMDMNDGFPDDDTGNCLQIDNDGIVMLNYKWRVSMAGQPVGAALNQLIKQMYRSK